MKALLKKEILDIIRDKKTLINMVVIPILFVPLLIIFINSIMKKSIEKLHLKTYKIGIYEKTEFKELKEFLKISNFTLLKTEKPESLIFEKEIDLGMIIDKNNKNLYSVQIIHSEGREESDFIRRRVKNSLSLFKEKYFKEKLKERGIEIEEVIPFVVSEKSVKTGKGFAGVFLGMMLGYIIVILMFTSSMYPAIDLIAGEKERRTLEILLSSPARRTQIILSKIFVVTLVATITAFLTILSLFIGFLKSGALYYEAAQGISILKVITPKDIFLLLSLVIPFALFVASLEIAIASYAKTYKEAQSLITPLTFIFIIPAFYSFVPGISFTLFHFLVPVMNLALTIKKIFQGEFIFIEYVLTMLSNLFFMFLTFFFSLKTFQKEKVLFRV